MQNQTMVLLSHQNQLENDKHHPSLYSVHLQDEQTLPEQHHLPKHLLARTPAKMTENENWQKEIMTTAPTYQLKCSNLKLSFFSTMVANLIYRVGVSFAFDPPCNQNMNEQAYKSVNRCENCLMITHW